jgi:NAD(P)-dependent dehydrogenase (short-subunit alcohol dehydrogenase family)
MKIAVFGATGQAGQLLVKKALADGYDVVAYARNPSKLDQRSEQLTVIQGELNDQASIEKTITGVDAVVSLLGLRGRTRTKPITLGMRNIIAAMTNQGIRRLIIVSTASAKDPNDRPDLKFRILVAIVKLLIRPAYEEIVSVADVVRNSDLDWTLVRLSLLSNKPATGKTRAGFLGRGEVKIGVTREDMVAFLLNQVGDARYLRQSPVISN